MLAASLAPRKWLASTNYALSYSNFTQAIEIQSIMANGEAISPGRDVRDSPQIKELWSKPNGRTVSNVSAISHQTGNDSSFVKEWLEVFPVLNRRNKTLIFLSLLTPELGFLPTAPSESAKMLPKL